MTFRFHRDQGQRKRVLTQVILFSNRNEMHQEISFRRIRANNRCFIRIINSRASERERKIIFACSKKEEAIKIHRNSINNRCKYFTCLIVLSRERRRKSSPYVLVCTHSLERNWKDMLSFQTAQYLLHANRGSRRRTIQAIRIDQSARKDHHL